MHGDFTRLVCLSAYVNLLPWLHCSYPLALATTSLTRHLDDLSEPIATAYIIALYLKSHSLRKLAWDATAGLALLATASPDLLNTASLNLLATAGLVGLATACLYLLATAGLAILATAGLSLLTTASLALLVQGPLPVIQRVQRPCIESNCAVATPLNEVEDVFVCNCDWISVNIPVDALSARRGCQ